MHRSFFGRDHNYAFRIAKDSPWCGNVMSFSANSYTRAVYKRRSCPGGLVRSRRVADSPLLLSSHVFNRSLAWISSGKAGAPDPHHLKSESQDPGADESRVKLYEIGRKQYEVFLTSFNYIMEHV